MPELPEIMNLASQMQYELQNKTFDDIQVTQPKCLNMPLEAFRVALLGQNVQDTEARGKWLVSQLSTGWLLINLGMGGEIFYHPDSQSIPAKYRVLFTFSDNTSLSLNFWWFGYVHWVRELLEHKMVSKVGINALDSRLDGARFRELIRGRKVGLKSFLLDQSHIAGIGNMYIHDILFLARLHPLRRLDTLSEAETQALLKAIRRVLRLGLDKGGSVWEKNLYNVPGGYTMEDILIGYREGQPCPVCATSIAKIRTGANTSYICPRCQPLACQVN